jgi:WD40 repeat protein
MWNINSGKCNKTVLDSVQGVIASLAISSDGRLLAYANETGIVQCLDLENPTSAPLRLPAFKSPVISIIFSNDGNSIAMGCQDGSIHVASKKDLSGKPISIIGRHQSGVTGLAFSEADHDIASSSFDWSVKIARFPVSEGKPISIDNHELWVYDILYSPDNKKIISCSADKTIRVFSTQNEDMAERLKKSLKRNMTAAEWKKMVGEDIPYQKTSEDLP